MKKLILFGMALLILLTSINSLQAVTLTTRDSQDCWLLNNVTPENETNIKSICGRGLNLTVTNVGKHATGKILLAYNFTPNTYFTPGTTPLCHIGDYGCSISYWFKPATSGTQNYHLVQGNADSSGAWGIWETTGNVIFWGVRDSAIGDWRSLTSGGLSIGTFYHICATYNLTNGRMDLYLNGISQGNVTVGSYDQTFNVGGSAIGTRLNDPGNEANGIMDAIHIINRTINSAECSDLYNAGNGLEYPYNATTGSNPALANFNITYPLNTSQTNNGTNLWFSATANVSANPNNVSLFLDGTKNATMNGTSGVNVLANFTGINLSSGTHTWYIQYQNGSTTSNSTQLTVYIDTSNPTISNNFVNNSVYFRNNLTAIINFTDDQILYEYNISIDNTQLAGNNSLGSATSLSYTFSYNTSLLSVGSHNLTIRVADGHTASEIMPMEVSDGLFNNHLRYDYATKDGSDFIRIDNKDSSIFDTFTTEKLRDRYTWQFKPNAQQSSYTFTITASKPIYIIDAPNTKYKRWLISGNKWMDFVIKNENPDIEIKKINDYDAEVTISNIENPESMQFESIGDLNIVSTTYTFSTIGATESHQSSVYEGSTATYNLLVNTTQIESLGTSASLIWNGVNTGSITKTIINENVTQFTKSFTTLSAPNPVNFTWFFNVSTFQFNLSANQSFIAMNITNCTAGNYIVLNYTLYDQTNLSIANAGVNQTFNQVIAVDMEIISQFNVSQSWNFSTVKTNSSELLICFPAGILNQSNLTINTIATYQYSGHVTQYHYLQNFTLSNNSFPQLIHLNDLESSKSTSFLINYQDENYLPVEGAIIDVIRKYVGLGASFSVEHGKTDLSGQTRAHLVTEDVVYRFNVFKNGTLLYSTPEYLALCQATPCQINIRKTITDNSSVSIRDNLGYTISDDNYVRANRSIKFTYLTFDGSSVNLNMTTLSFSAYENDTVCSNTSTSSGGTLTCGIPLSYANTTFTASIYKNGKFFGSKSYSLAPSAFDLFGNTGIMLSAFAYLLLVLMAISSGIMMIVMGAIGLAMVTMLAVFAGGGIFGIGSAVVWFMTAGGIIIWKLTQRRVQ